MLGALGVAHARPASWHATRALTSQLLQDARGRVLEAVHAVRGTDVRVFGAIARGTDQPGSEIDPLGTFPREADIVTLLTLEEGPSDLLRVPVNVISTGSSEAMLARAR